MNPGQVGVQPLVEAWLSGEVSPERLTTCLEDLLAAVPALHAARLFVAGPCGAHTVAVRRTGTDGPWGSPGTTRSLSAPSHTENPDLEVVLLDPPLARRVAQRLVQALGADGRSAEPVLIQKRRVRYRQTLGPQDSRALAVALGETRRPAPATLCAPLVVSGVLRGTLHLDGDAGALPDLTGTARLLAAALAGLIARLDAEQALRAVRRELALTDRVQAAIRRGGTLQELFGELCGAVRELLGIEHVGIGLLEGARLHLSHSTGEGCWASGLDAAQGIAGRVARSGQAELIRDVWADPAYLPIHPGVVSEICVPLLDGERVVGILNVESESRPLEEGDLRPLRALGTWLGGPLERERLYAESERHRRALDLLHRLRSSFGRHLDPSRAIRAVTEGLASAFGYTHVSVYLRRAGADGRPGLVLQHQVGYERVIEQVPLERGVMGRACRSGEVQWVPDMRLDPDALVAMDGLASEICVPLRQGAEVVGALNVETVGAGGLREWDVHIVSTVGSYLQQALERAWLHAQVQEREALYRLLAEHTGDLVCLHGARGHFTYVSPSVAALLGYSAAELLGRAPAELLYPESRRALNRAWRAGLGEPLRLRARHRQGHDVWLDTHLSRVSGPQGVQVLSSSRDVTARREAEERLRHTATHDHLTGLGNRAQFQAALEGQFALARQGLGSHALLYIDMNRFKVVNDSLGHAAGDELLVAFADRLRRTVGEGALVSRLGGDEFTVLVGGPPERDLAAVLGLAHRIQGALAEPFSVQGRAVQVSVSIGIAQDRPEHERPADLLRDADLSMYRAKRSPQCAVDLYDPSLHRAALRQLHVEAALPHAAALGQLGVAYQPIVHLRSGELRSFEALVRWQHPELGPVTPDEFIPLAEELGLIGGIGEFVLREACLAFRDAPGEVGVQVNVSPRQFLHLGFAETVRGALRETGLPARRLHLEITESALVLDVEVAAQTLRALRDLGVSVHIDDFGTGHSSLAFLHRFPVDGLKIDRAFIARLGEDQISANLVGTVLRLARTLGASVTAEGIETPTQRDRLLQLGCAQGQGYLFGRPLGKEEALRRLGAQPPSARPAGEDANP